MEVIITNSADEMSKKGAELVAAAVKKNPKAVLGLATGGTPVKMYAELIKLYKSGDFFLEFDMQIKRAVKETRT